MSFRLFVKSCLCTTICLIVVSIGMAQTHVPGKTEIRVGYWGGSDSECSPGTNAYYAGGDYAFSVQLRPYGKGPRDVEYTGISDWAWPKGLIVTASVSSSPLEYSAELTKKMQVRYYVSDMQAIADSVWRATGHEPSRVLRSPEYFFAFHIPEKMAGSSLCFKVEWNHPTYGHLSADPICIFVVAACSESALNKMRSTHVIVAQEERECDRAITLADSMINLGWHEALGLLYAATAARRCGRPDTQERFDDLFRKEPPIRWTE